jgi:hypothetical protein
VTTETIPTTTNLEDIELHVDGLDPKKAARIYQEHGALVVRGLMRDYVADVHRDIEQTVQETLADLDKAEKIPDGWRTPNGTLLIPAPENFGRDKQVMVLGLTYRTSGAFFLSALHKPILDIAEAILGPNVELYMDGQSLYKEPVGGHPKNLHQDGAYFEHKYEGPMAVLNYVVPTDLENGALYVVPGSHKLGVLDHVDTLSHLGLDENEWPWERAVPITGEPGDSIFFHVKTIHGSKPNYSDKPRPVFIHRYRRLGDYVTVSASSTERRKQAEKEADKKTAAGQEGLVVRGFRSRKQEL